MINASCVQWIIFYLAWGTSGMCLCVCVCVCVFVDVWARVCVMVRVVKPGHNGILALSHTTPLLLMCSSWWPSGDRKVSPLIVFVRRTKGGKRRAGRISKQASDVFVVADAKLSPSQTITCFSLNQSELITGERHADGAFTLITDLPQQRLPKLFIFNKICWFQTLSSSTLRKKIQLYKCYV